MQSASKGPKGKAAAGKEARPVADLALDQSVGYQVRMTNRAFQARLKQRVEPFGVSSGMWYFLRILWQSDGQTQSALSRQIGLMEPTAVAALASMERRGLIARAKDATDRRKINVFLTDHGRALREQMLPLVHEINAEGLKSLTQTERKTLLRLLKRIEVDLLATSRRAAGGAR